jgi:hypothetical protein
VELVVARVRTSTIAYAGGGSAVSLFDGSTVPGSSSTKYSWCSDVIGNKPNPNPLQIEHFYNCRWLVSGTNEWYWVTHSYGTTWPNPGHVGGAGEPSDNTTLAKALARTNPNRADIALPVFLFELRDIPKMIREWGHTLLKKPMRVGGGKDLRYLPKSVGKRYLEYEFGIVPLLSDLGRILNFTALVDKRIDMLNRLGESSPPSSSATTWEQSDIGNPYWSPATALYQEHRWAQCRLESEYKKWCSTIWSPASKLPSNPRDQFLLAHQLVFGLDLSLSNLWEAMPWSWLIDWFGNVGDVLKANRNTIPVKHTGSCIMRMATTKEITLQISLAFPGDSLTLVRPPFTAQSKSRTVVGDAAPLPEFNLPFLNGKQLSILSALAVTRR